MSDPTMHNRLYSAGRQSFLEGRSCEPRGDPVVREYTAGLAVGDQFAVEIEGVFEAGFNDARDAGPGNVQGSSNVQKEAQED